jgi:HD-like signal output (HDOD) protein
MALRKEGRNLKKYIDKAMVDLPAMPAVVVQIIEATDKETVSTAMIESHLNSDAAIAAKLLKVVNSAYFGLPKQVSHTGQAIAILGIQQVRNLVMSLGVMNALTSTSPKIQEAQLNFWRHSFGSAACAQALALKSGLDRKGQELAFISGLLHDIGRLFMVTAFFPQYQHVLDEAMKQGKSLVEVEMGVMGVAHDELGAVLAERWNFPDRLVQVVRLHERPDGVLESELLQLVGCVHAADRIASIGWLGEASAPVWPWNSRAMDAVGLCPKAIEPFKKATRERVEQAAQLLGSL